MLTNSATTKKKKQSLQFTNTVSRKNDAIKQANGLGYDVLLDMIEVKWLGKPQTLYRFENSVNKTKFYVGFNRNQKSVMFTELQFDNNFGLAWVTINMQEKHDIN